KAAASLLAGRMSVDTPLLVLYDDAFAMFSLEAPCWPSGPVSAYAFAAAAKFASHCSGGEQCFALRSLCAFSISLHSDGPWVPPPTTGGGLVVPPPAAFCFCAARHLWNWSSVSRRLTQPVSRASLQSRSAMSFRFTPSITQLLPTTG